MAATVLSLLLLGQAAATASATPQERFDAAATAMAENDCDRAISLLETLEKSDAARKNASVAAAIAARKGVCLIRLGRGGDGETLVRGALPLLEKGGEGYRGDVRIAHLMLGQRAIGRLDYPAANEHGRAALAVSTGMDRIPPLQLLARVGTFDDGAQPLAYADEALALIRSDPERTKADIAAAMTLRARILMNQGRLKEAQWVLGNALNILGGLNRKVTQAGVVTRFDLAIAAMLNGNKAAARVYLAYTGAGRMEYAPFSKAIYMSPPACGTAGLKPDDFAIVEFSIKDDGSVADITPIYTTGGTAVALEFARSVSQWSWKPEEVKAIPPFFRDITRIELRCSLAGQQADLMAPLAAQSVQWLAQLDGTPASTALSSSATEIPKVKAALQRERAAGNHVAMIGLLGWLGNNNLISDAERIGYLDEAIALARGKSAPQAVQTRLAIMRLFPSGWSPDAQQRRLEGLLALLPDPQVQSDAIGLATIRLLITEPFYSTPNKLDTEALLQAVVAEPRLPARHPLKVVALLKQADILARRGDGAGAQQAFAQTGLSEEQCALLGVKPAVRKSGAKDSLFPMEAMRMGFEGWVRTEFDIAADGTTAGQRVIAAYPPFIFNEAATGINKNTRYEASYRPEGGVACSANSGSLAFRIAN